MATETKSAPAEIKLEISGVIPQTLATVLGKNQLSNGWTPFYVGKTKSVIYGSPPHLESRVGFPRLADIEGKIEADRPWLGREIDLTQEHNWKSFLRVWLDVNALTRDACLAKEISFLEYLSAWQWIEELKLDPKEHKGFLEPWLSGVVKRAASDHNWHHEKSEEFSIFHDIVATLSDGQWADEFYDFYGGLREYCPHV